MATRAKARRRPRRRHSGRTASLAAPLIGIAGFALVLGLYARYDRLLPWLAGAYAVLAVLTLGLYAWDKRAAMQARSRIPEQTLPLLALAGGWPGAMLARPLFRHKTRKMSFLVVFYLATAVNLAVLGWLLFADNL